MTGASTGIGRELARLLAADGYSLALVARDAAKLEELAREIDTAHGSRTAVFPRDLAEEGGAAALLEDAAKLGLSIDVLVNNAGAGVYGPFASTDLDRELATIRLNVVALTALTKGVLPDMLRRGSGRILNVASTAAFQPGPLMAVYYATKAYVLSFSEAIANEVAGTGVTVTALCPGPTATEFQKAAGFARARLFPGPLVMDARSVARAGYDGMRRGRRVVIPGLANRLMVQALRISPRRLVTAVAGRIQKSRGE